MEEFFQMHRTKHGPKMKLSFILTQGKREAVIIKIYTNFIFNILEGLF